MKITGIIEDSIEVATDEARCRVKFLATEPAFKGHFPGEPVVPGVLMLGGLAALAQCLTPGLLASVGEAKFRAMVRPEEELVYRVTRSGEGFAGVVEKIGGEEVLSAKLKLSPLQNVAH